MLAPSSDRTASHGNKPSIQAQEAITEPKTRRDNNPAGHENGNERPNPWSSLLVALWSLGTRITSADTAIEKTDAARTQPRVLFSQLTLPLEVSSLPLLHTGR
jgi:hypothetical protein